MRLIRPTTTDSFVLIICSRPLLFKVIFTEEDWLFFIKKNWTCSRSCSRPCPSSFLFTFRFVPRSCSCLLCHVVLVHVLGSWLFIVSCRACSCLVFHVCHVLVHYVMSCLSIIVLVQCPCSCVLVMSLSCLCSCLHVHVFLSCLHVSCLFMFLS